MTPKNPIAQYAVSGLEADRELIRSVAEHLAKGGPSAERTRVEIGKLLSKKGGIVAALLQSPLVGAELNLTRDHTPPRRLDL